jgi:hypothetical protein
MLGPARDHAAAGRARRRSALQGALKTLFNKRAPLYHSDRYAQEPERQEVYVRLMQEVNQARDRGDIATLREIAAPRSL